MSHPPQTCINAFSPEYLSALRERDETSDSALEAELAGPWTVREHDRQYHLFREWESFETGHRPFGSFATREDALLFLTALRMLAWPPLFKGREPAAVPADHRIEREGEDAGATRTFLPDLLLAANVLARLVRSAPDLANVLGLAGGTTQESTGELLGVSVLARAVAAAEA
ncbi:MAG TPA: hypothetical protein VGS07_08310 [Thermoanaerobaculia bacterium]|jgi:hypothetical protein|nr:hypothetical protein [Thermoanaerobaculia bacterium]